MISFNKIKSATANLKNKFNSKFRKRILALTVVAIAAVLVLPITPFSTVTLAYEVKLNNETIGFVSGKEVLNQAKSIVKNKKADVVIKPQYSRTLVVNASLDNANDISNNIIQSENILSAYGIYANNKCIVMNYNKTVLMNALENVKSSALKSSKADIAEFDKSVEIKKVLGLKSDIDFEIKNIIKKVNKSVKVKLGFVKNEKKVIKFKTIKQKDNTLYKGLTSVEKEGQNGLKVKKTITYYIDGKKTQKVTVKSKTKKQTITKVVKVGTKKAPNSDKNGGIYVWPLEKGTSCYISSGFGYRSGRLHKGIDIIANRGTAIVAAADGKVVRSSVFYSYGNCIDIMQTDGTLTRYAHCSKLIAKVGDKVKAGTVIALVGCTGRSTANHLHFEVHPNGGAPVNPSDYVKK